LGITQLDLKAQTSTEVNNGNLIGLTSSYTTSDGATHGMADVWFATSKDASTDVAAAVPASQPSLQLPPANVAADSSGGAPAISGAQDALRSQVVSMVDAMASFGSASGSGGGAAPGDASLTQPAGSNPTVGMTGMVDAMRQFDANGQPKLAGGLSAEAVAATLNTTPTRKPDTDILASSK
jgi:hypothetical protein